MFTVLGGTRSSPREGSAFRSEAGRWCEPQDPVPARCRAHDRRIFVGVASAHHRLRVAGREGVDDRLVLDERYAHIGHPLWTVVGRIGLPPDRASVPCVCRRR